MGDQEIDGLQTVSRADVADLLVKQMDDDARLQSAGAH